MTKFENTFRIESARLKEWDYSNPWWYYVSINTKDYIHYFGKVVNEKILLNDLGIIAIKCWEDIPNHFPNVDIDYFVVMPNHMHGILIINPIERQSNVKTPDRASLQLSTLGKIINQFKGSVKRWANNNNYQKFVWQSRFYNRIIRNQQELHNVRKYIEQNPIKWSLEKDSRENIYEL